MDINAEKLKLIEWLSGLQDVKTITLLNSIKDSNQFDLTEEEKAFVDVGLNDLKEEKIVYHSKVEEEAKKKYPDLFK